MRRHFLSILSIACLTIATSSYGQRMPIYSLFLHEPYLYNPAEVASDEFTSITGSHRQQWRGIEGAPIVSTLLFQTPFDYKKGAIGATVRNFERGLLSTIEALGTYGYTIYFTKTTTVHFGLSGGVTSTTLNIPADDAMNDPALLNALDYRMEPIANFGFKIRSKSGLNFGASLPTLFRPGFVGESHFNNISFSPFDNVTVMTYFRKKLEKKIVTRKRRGAYGRVAKKNEYAPLELYAIYNYGRFSDQRIELLAKLSIGDYLTVGGSYRIGYGPTAMFGVEAGNFSFNYGYEIAPKQAEGFIQGSHEIQLKYRIGDKKKLERTKPVLLTVKKTDEHEARFSHKDVQTGGSGEQDTYGKRYYVVLRDFTNFEAADQFVRYIKEKNDLNTSIFYNDKNKQFYVYIYETTKSSEANKEKKAVEELTKFKNVRIIILDDK